METYSLLFRGGTYGQLQVTYATSELDLVKVAASEGKAVYDYYGEGQLGAPSPIYGTAWDVAGRADPYLVRILMVRCISVSILSVLPTFPHLISLHSFQSCASLCLITEACKSYAFNSKSLNCVWYTASNYEVIDNRTNYVFWSKNIKMVSALPWMTHIPFYCIIKICIDDWKYLTHSRLSLYTRKGLFQALTSPPPKVRSQ